MDVKELFSFLEWLLCGRSILGGPGILGLALGFFTPGQLSVEFVNIGGWLTHGDLSLDSCAQFLAVAEHKSAISCGRLGTSLFRLLPARIRLLGVMLGLGLLVLVVPLLPSLLILPLGFRSSFDWAGL